MGVTTGVTMGGNMRVPRREEKEKLLRPLEEGHEESETDHPVEPASGVHEGGGVCAHPARLGGPGVVHVAEESKRDGADLQQEEEHEGEGQGPPLHLWE